MDNKKDKGKLYNITRQYSFDSAPQNQKWANFTVDQWLNVIENMIKQANASNLIEYMAYIYHDRDKDDKGNLIDIHVHIFVKFKKVQLQKDVYNWFEVSRDANAEVVEDAYGSAKYLIHISDAALKEKKFIYDINDVKTVNCDYRDLINPDYWKKEDKNVLNPLRLVKQKQAVAFADSIGYMLRNGDLMPQQAYDEFEAHAGYGWLRSFRKGFEDDRKAYVEKEMQKIKDGEVKRDLLNIYIAGAGGIGKSHLRNLISMKLANGKGVQTAGSGKDILGNYKGEARLDIDEIESSNFESIDSYNDIFDPHSHGEVASRYYDKMFIGTGFAVTNSISPLQFANDLMVYSKGGSKYQDPARKRTINYNCSTTMDKYWQVRRRMQINIVLKRDEDDTGKINGYIFNLRFGIKNDDGTINYDDGTHILMGQFSYRRDVDEEPVVSESTLDYIIEVMNLSTAGCFDGYQTIDEFLIENDIDEKERDEIIDSFIEDVIDHTVWDLLPTRFLYDIYKIYVKSYYPEDNLLSIQEFTKSLMVLLDDFEYKKDVRTSDKTDEFEQLIVDYNLSFPNYYGTSIWENVMNLNGSLRYLRGSVRKEKYNGFVRL